MSFYAAIADEYDSMTGSAERRAAAQRFLRRILEGHSVDAALDAACGTGLYALALVESGVRFVVGADLEPAMLARAVRSPGGDRVLWVAADMTALARTITKRFDLILCLGNSLPHILDPDSLRRTLAGFRDLLAPEGALWIQTLNYDRILARRERIVSIDRTGDREFVRFYDFLENGLVRFNLLRIRWSEAAPAFSSLDSTVLHPYRCRELTESIPACGLRIAGVFGSLELDSFDADGSPTCLIQAVRA